MAVPGVAQCVDMLTLKEEVSCVDVYGPRPIATGWLDQV
ncbi:hypothetical protein FHR98_003298 [Limibacillus halophilus]|uniref:Uncharacterized protein n=1 Tax=Limibacillus halophilus TaxID=1579333 RepID=A0A839SW10_9PROT|nr:hypothetical protein [Limibacillus halophilus]